MSDISSVSPRALIPAGAASGAGRAVRGGFDTDPLRNFRFIVSFYPVAYLKTKVESSSFTPLGIVGFNSVSGMAVSTEPVTIREGGYNATVHQIPSQANYSPITMQRGVLLGTYQNWQWMRSMLDVIQGRATPARALFRCDVEVAVLHYPVRYSTASNGFEYTVDTPGRNATSYARATYDDAVAMRFRFYNAWPSSIAYSDLNASDNALMVEQMTMYHEGMDMRWGYRASDSAIANADNFGNITVPPPQ